MNEKTIDNRNMTNDQKSSLVNFLTRPSMYILLSDRNNFISFIHGFETCIVPNHRSEYSFSSLLKKYLEDEFSINGGATGWPYQVEVYAGKKNLSWVTAFRRIALHVLFSKESGQNNHEMTEFVKSRIQAKIDYIESKMWFNENWKEDWNSIDLNDQWLTKLYTKNELKILREMDREINTNQVFLDKNTIPTDLLLDLKEQWMKLRSKSVLL